jgi:threonine synthase
MPASVPGRESSLWRYAEVLPVRDPNNRVSFGEGWTPLLKADRLAATLPLKLALYIKDEGQNPTQSFKARGMTAAISMAKELGVTKVAVPSAGNAAGAMSAYAARAGMEAFIFMPSDTPRANIIECEQTGAHVTLVDGLITDCGKIVAERKEAEGWFDVSTLKEPYRVEGKKTMGYELFEQFSSLVTRHLALITLPDVILYPTGGGTGLIGMWKAFDEMEQMGWIDSKRPRMVSVQSETCAPIVRAFRAGERFADEFQNAATVASGLRVPKAIGDFLILDAIRASGGTAIAVSDDELVAAVREIGAAEGIFAAPEGAACLPALRKLIDKGDIKAGESVVIFNTGSGIKYLEAFE